MELRNKFIINALIGFIIGIFIGLAFWFIGDGEMDQKQFILQLVMSGILGMISMGVMTVYDIESWGLTRATIVHYSTWLVTFLAISIPMGWYEPWYVLVIAVVILTIIYALIWMGFYLHWKKTIRQMNRQLDEIHRKQKEE